jgi:DNA-binding LytR/AlgR family response regulator
MQEYEKRLPDQHFMRIHRSYIVNFSFIEKTDKHAHHTALLFLKGLNDPVKISRSYYKKIKERYM